MQSKRILALILSGVLTAAALIGCGGNKKQSGGSTAVNNTKTESQSTKVAFPLKNPVTIKITTYNSKYDLKQYTERERSKQLAKETNINFDYNIVNSPSTAEFNEKLKLMLTAGDFGDVIIGISDNLVSTNIENGNIVPLEKYITEDLAPTMLDAFSKRPELKKNAIYPDGHMYQLMMLEEILPTWMENNLIINKKWMEKLELKEPKTTDELYILLKAFKEKDPNGNDKNDEIPISFVDQNAMMHIEAFMGFFGLAYKHGMNDGYCTIENGKVQFAPTRLEYKEGLKYLRKLYSEGLMDQESFTQKEANLRTKLQQQTDTIGSIIFKDTSYFKNADNYAVIPPVSAQGKKANIWVNPGVNGKRAGVVLTKNNKYQEITMAFFDRYFDAKNKLLNDYGASAYEENGMVKFKPAPDGKAYVEWKNETMFYTYGAGVLFEEDLGKKVEIPLDRRGGEEYVKMYKPYFAKEIWPRPMFKNEETERLAQLRTDIFNYVKTMKAKFITDPKTDIDAEWDKYTASFEKMGMAEFLKIMQVAYDRYSSAK